jgi:hypothetical protein
MRIFLAALLLVPAAALAGSSSFDGTWKMRVDSVKFGGKADSFLLADGIFTCSSCDPALKVPADGADHPVSGHAYYDSVTVKVVNPMTIEIIYHRAGKVSSHDILTVSADGKTLTDKFANFDGTQEASGRAIEKRLGAGPAGAHAISGEWQVNQFTANQAASTVSYEMTGEHFKMKANGQSYDAKFDGQEYPVVGDPGHTTVTLKRIDANTVEETDHRQGKVTDVIRLATAADGKSLQLEDKDLAHGQTVAMTLDKQL